MVAGYLIGDAALEAGSAGITTGGVSTLCARGGGGGCVAGPALGGGPPEVAAGAVPLTRFGVPEANVVG